METDRLTFFKPINHAKIPHFFLHAPIQYLNIVFRGKYILMYTCILYTYLYRIKKKKMELSQSVAYPQTGPCNRTGVTLWKTKYHGSAKTVGKIITFTKGINFKNSWNIVMVLVCCTFL